MAFPGWIAEVSAGTGIHRGGQHESRRKRNRDGSARNGHRAIFERLAHHFQHVALKFGKLVKKQDTIMAEGDFPRTRDRATTDRSGIADRVMWRAKRPGSDQAAAVFQDTGDTVNACRLDGFVERHRRQDSGDTLRQHRLAGAWWANEQDVVPAGAQETSSARLAACCP